MNDVIATALDAAQLAGASYADARVVDTRQESISVRTGRVEGIETSESLGIGIRVIAEGAWGFAATADLSPDGIRTAAREAVALADDYFIERKLYPNVDFYTGVIYKVVNGDWKFEK